MMYFVFKLMFQGFSRKLTLTHNEHTYEILVKQNAQEVSYSGIE